MGESEKKQLNLSAPLLSARRYSSPLRPSSSSLSSLTTVEEPSSKKEKKSDSNMVEVVRPGSVPFQWEHIPGKAKTRGDDSKNGRNFEHVTRIPGVKSGELTGCLRTPPPQHRETQTESVPPSKLSGELNLIRPQTRITGKSNLSGLITCVKKSDNILNKNTTTDYLQTTEYDEEDIDIAFSDALDALECTSMNCSTSGSFRGSNNFVVGGGSAPDSKTENREFMMNRFLPAAKAMSLESPPSNKRQMVVAVKRNEKFQPPPFSNVFIPKIVKHPPPLSSEQNLPYTTRVDIRSQQQSEDEDEEEEDDDDDDDSFIEPNPVKSFGFFPWFCSKNSLRLVNPVPAMKMKTKNALVSAQKAGKSWVTNASPKQHVPCSPQIHQVRSTTTKSCELFRQLEPPKLNRQRPVFYSGELQIRNHQLQARNGGLSPYRNYRRTSVVSPLRTDSSYHLILPNKQESSINNNNWSAAMPVTHSPPTSNTRQRNLPIICQDRSIVVEKTVHVDPGNVTRSRQIEQEMIVNPNPLGMEKIVKSTNYSTTVPPPPPLPKSPSESWLSRSLMSSGSPRNSFSGSKFPSRQQSPAKTRPMRTHGDSKWENIVKGSHLQQYHQGRYSEELVARVFTPQSRSTK